MAKPRVFISSTFYDLRTVRNDLRRFILDMGYEPVEHDKGEIPYGKDFSPEDYCYEEIGQCDMLVSIIGGRFGSESEEKDYSISQVELKTAHKLGKQVYIFIQKDVLFEHQFYLNNKSIKSTKYQYVDDIRIHKFIEEVNKLPKNNPIQPFETSQDIIIFLKAQWAGLFQRMLQQKDRMEEINKINELENISQTLNSLVTYLKEESKGKDEAIQTILLASHPAFEDLRKKLNIPFRVYFTNSNELKEYLTAYRYEPIGEDKGEIDIGGEIITAVYTVYEKRYIKRCASDEGIPVKRKIIAQVWIYRDIFDDNGRLRIIPTEEWNEDFIKYHEESESRYEDNDWPF